MARGLVRSMKILTLTEFELILSGLMLGLPAPSGGRQAMVPLTFNEMYSSTAIHRLRARRIGGSLERIMSFSGLFPSIALSNSSSIGQLPSKVKPTMLD